MKRNTRTSLLQTICYKTSVYILTFGMLLSPFLITSQIANAAGGGLVPFVPSECYGRPTQSGDGTVSVNCGWPQFVQLGRNVIQNAIYLAFMAAIISIVYAGYLFMTSGGDEGNRKKGKEILWKVVQGIFFTLVAWLLVATILKFLGVNKAYSLLS